MKKTKVYIVYLTAVAILIREGERRRVSSRPGDFPFVLYPPLACQYISREPWLLERKKKSPCRERVCSRDYSGLFARLWQRRPTAASSHTPDPIRVHQQRYSSTSSCCSCFFFFFAESALVRMFALRARVSAHYTAISHDSLCTCSLSP